MSVFEPDSITGQPKRFRGSFTQQDALPAEAIDAAVKVLQTSRLHRYNLAPDEIGEVAQLEAEFAAWQGRRYCLAVTSGGQALQLALRAAGLGAGETVLTNAFTLAPVPGAITGAGGRPLLVETTEDLGIDIDDLAAKADRSGARILLLSHMRGHLCDMDRLQAVVRAHSLILLEDCAHSMGALWDGIRSGNHGTLSCFSTQTYKHMNSGEGGFIVGDDPELMARATILSGSYMHYGRHGAAPDTEAFEKVRLETPNLSARMDALRAAVLRPQLPLLDRKVEQWNRLHDALSAQIEGVRGVALPQSPEAARRVGSSFQFRLPDLSADACETLVSMAARAGVELKWVGAAAPVGFTSSHHSWTYVGRQDLPRTDRILSTLFDMRLPLSFTVADCELIGSILRGLVAHLSGQSR